MGRAAAVLVAVLCILLPGCRARQILRDGIPFDFGLNPHIESATSHLPPSTLYDSTEKKD